MAGKADSGRAGYRAGIAIAFLLALGACGDIALPGFLSGAGGGSRTAGDSATTRMVERDVEAPEVFQVTDKGLWDGRPVVGGVWVAYPDVTDPERVIIRNTENGKFVIGALFRRERVAPGPRFQVSSDAAAALGMLAGQPAELNVTALKREEVPDGGDASQPAAETVEQGSLDDPIAAAAAALDAAEGIAPAPRPTAAAPQTPVASSLAKPYIQIGIFSIEENAKSTVTRLARAGIQGIIKPGTSAGKPFWRVLVGPAATADERRALLKRLEALGFSDAYFVKN